MKTFVSFSDKAEWTIKFIFKAIFSHIFYLPFILHSRTIHISITMMMICEKNIYKWNKSSLLSSFKQFFDFYRKIICTRSCEQYEMKIESSKVSKGRKEETTNRLREKQIQGTPQDIDNAHNFLHSLDRIELCNIPKPINLSSQAKRGGWKRETFFSNKAFKRFY